MVTSPLTYKWMNLVSLYKINENFHWHHWFPFSDVLNLEWWSLLEIELSLKVVRDVCLRISIRLLSNFILYLDSFHWMKVSTICGCALNSPKLNYIVFSNLFRSTFFFFLTELDQQSIHPADIHTIYFP